MRIAGIIISLLCLFIACRIEIFNQTSITQLPRPPDSGKWRTLAYNAAKKAHENQFKSNNGIPPQSQLTHDQQAEVDQKFRDRHGAPEANRRDADFLRFVSTWGLLQYLAAPVLLVFAIVHMKRRQLAYGSAFLAISVIALALLSYRDYYGSLGW
ncbi:MAG TPA: hypothetical protein VEL07_07715 [Planctomycetota bacterium]|nr:hypothetical protein [Planctomycetota bacterium]